MANTIIDCDHNIDLKNIEGVPGDADVDADVRVVIRKGLTKAQAHAALLVNSNALIGDAISLE